MAFLSEAIDSEEALPNWHLLDHIRVQFPEHLTTLVDVKENHG